MNLITLKEITKIYAGEGAAALGIRNINLSFSRGEFVVVTGKSGCGKTTLLNVLSGMDSYESGEMFVEGQPTAHYEQRDWESYREAYISFIFQDYNIIDSFTVLENVELALLHIRDKKERRAKAMALIERVGLTSHIKHKGSKLSGGQKQRTVIARALAKDSPIILADEPTGNLDKKSSEDIADLLGSIAKDKLIVVVTHNYEDFAAYATRHILLFDGQVESDVGVGVPLEGTESSVAEGEKNGKDDSPDKETREDLVAVSADTAGTAEVNKSRGARVRRWTKAFAKRQSDAAILGWHRFFSRPKLSIFLTSMVTIAACLLLMVTSVCLMAMQTDYGDHVAEIDGRLLVARADGTAIDGAAAEALATETGARAAFYDLLFDRSLSMEVYLDDYPTHYSMGVTDEAAVVQKGRAPAAAHEVALRLPIFMKGKIGLGQRSFYFGQEIFAEYEVVGLSYFYDNTKNALICMTREGFRDASAGYLMRTIDVGASIKIGQNSEDVAAVILCGDDVASGTALYRNSFKETHWRSAEIVLTCNGIEYDFSDASDAQALATAQPPYEYERNEVCQIKISRADFERIAAQQNRQFSLFFRNDRLARQHLATIEAQGYNAVLSTEANKLVETEYSDPIPLLIALGWIGAVIVLCLCVYLICMRSVTATRGDVGIFRSMGLSEKTVRASLYWYMLIAAAFAAVVMGILACCLFMTGANQYFRFLHTGGYVLIIAATALMAADTARRFNKRLYRQNVRKNLRGNR